MKRTLLFLSLITLCLLQAYPQNDGDDIIIGKYRKLHSAITNEDRTLLIWLPRSYKESSLSYPVSICFTDKTHPPASCPP